MFCEIARTVLYWAVILSGTVSLTMGVFKIIDAIERPLCKKHR